MEGFLAALLLAMVLAGPAKGQERPRPPPDSSTCERQGSTDSVRSISDRGEIALASGRLAKLAGARLPDDPQDRERAVAWLRQAIGRTVAMASFGPQADRWGRVAANLVLDDETGPIDLARSLVSAGLALVDAGEEGALCRPDLLAVETRARDSGLGLWAGDRYKPLAADDLDRLRARIGTFALVEGRVRSVGERQRRTYLNFGHDWGTDLTITMPKRSWDLMRERGHTAAALRGRRIRARGVLEEWRGPAMTLVAVELLEIMDNASSQRR
jgi:hypothetical protein